MPGRASCPRFEYHEPCARSLHTHPHHRDPEFDSAIHASTKRLWVVTAVSNPVRFKTRYSLYRKFREHVTRDLGLNLLTVEAALGGRDFQLTNDATPDAVEYATVSCDGHTVQTIDVRVRGDSQVWLKEVLWNVGARVLPHDCEYVVFCDADIEFHDRNIGTEVIHALQEYKVIQPFETVADMGPDGQIMDVHRSFGWCHAMGWEWRPRSDGRGCYYTPKPKDVGPEGFGNAFHPGYALAMRMSVLRRLQLLEVGVLGAGDHHQCAALIGKAALSVPRGINKEYRKRVMDWQDRAKEVVNGSFGYARGTILHGFHGAKANRKYVSRWSILIEHDFDPSTDLYTNSNGLPELRDNKPELRDAIMRYFRQRDEDSPSMA